MGWCANKIHPLGGVRICETVVETKKRCSSFKGAKKSRGAKGIVLDGQRAVDRMVNLALAENQFHVAGMSEITTAKYSEGR